MNREENRRMKMSWITMSTHQLLLHWAQLPNKWLSVIADGNVRTNETKNQCNEGNQQKQGIRTVEHSSQYNISSRIAVDWLSVCWLQFKCFRFTASWKWKWINGNLRRFRTCSNENAFVYVFSVILDRETTNLIIPFD